MEQKGELIIYKSKSGEVEIKTTLKNDSIWLSLNQMADLFGADKSGISRHIKNIYLTRELIPEATVAKIATVQKEGRKTVKRYIENYNLDMILSVGYRVNSKKATDFRVWATKTLRQYLVQGYLVNDKRFIEAQKIVRFIAEKSKTLELTGHEKEILDVIERYSKTWKVLGQYDEGKIEIKKQKKAKFALNYYKCHEIIEELREDLVKKKIAGDLFGSERSHGLEGIIGNLYQTFDGNELYDSIEEKAAHLLYFVIKDHPFSDGNKRIGSLLFLYFLEQNSFLFKKTGETKIADRTLVALALLIASSDPKEKETMVRLIINLVQD
jgi:death-on-curing family protein